MSGFWTGRCLFLRGQIRSALKSKINMANHGKIYDDYKGGFGQYAQNDR